MSYESECPPPIGPADPEVTDLKLDVVAGAVIASWVLPAGAIRAHITRTESVPPAHADDGRIVSASATGFIEGGLRVGVPYFYRIAVERCTADGRLERSPGLIRGTGVITAQAAFSGDPSPNGSMEDLPALNAEDFEDYLLLTWQWPASCRQAEVTWRRDGRFPTGPEDTAAESLRFTVGEYHLHGGFRLAQPDRRAPYHFTVYPRYEAGGAEPIRYGRGARAVLRESAQVTVHYHIRRVWWPWGSYQLVLWSKEDVSELPALSIVAATGERPPPVFESRHLVAGTGLLRLERDRPVKACLFYLSDRARPLHLRVCFREDTPVPFVLQPHAPARLRLD